MRRRTAHRLFCALLRFVFVLKGGLSGGNGLLCYILSLSHVLFLYIRLLSHFSFRASLFLIDVALSISHARSLNDVSLASLFLSPTLSLVYLFLSYILCLKIVSLGALRSLRGGVCALGLILMKILRYLIILLTQRNRSLSLGILSLLVMLSLNQLSLVMLSLIRLCSWVMLSVETRFFYVVLSLGNPCLRVMLILASVSLWSLLTLDDLGLLVMLSVG